MFGRVWKITETATAARPCHSPDMSRSRPILAYDARAHSTGIGRYTEQLLSRLRSSVRGAELWCIAHPANAQRLAAYVDRVIPCSAPMYSLGAQVAIPNLLDKVTLLHCPHYDVPMLYARPMSVTIHDVTHLIDPAFRNTFKSRVFAKSLLKVAVAKARRIVTVSQYSKQMILEHVGGTEEKICVIYSSANPVFVPMPRQEAKETVRRQLGLCREFVLFVGSPKPHKNLPVLFEAFALLRSRNRDTPELVVIGKDKKYEPALRKLAVRLEIDDSLRWIDSISDELLRACYSAAEATILPSRQEGFGFPIIESMACGTPVICSKAASLPEVAGGCALLFDPSSPEDCCEQLSRVLQSSQLRSQLREKGLKRASQFAGAKAVEEHAQLFTELLAN
jgi:glycosyltransferase involved in cell wall biosynthesis